MLRRNRIITTAALAACALPASQAMAAPDGISPVAADHVIVQQSDRSPQALERNYGTPDALDAIEKRGLYAVEPGPNALNRPAGSPDAFDATSDRPPVQVPLPTVQVRDTPSSGFDWGDAGIGAAGMLALLSIAAGSTLLVSGLRRRRGFQVVSH
jgi:hypothetical protein